VTPIPLPVAMRGTPLENVEDRTLADRVVTAGDSEAFRVLYVRHTTALYALALRISGNTQDAEDAVHDAWVRGVDGLGGFEWRSTLRTWLASIVVNRLREIDRRRPQALPDEDTGEAPAKLEPLPSADRIDLDRAIAALAPGYRRVLVLHDVEGFTHEEIARMLGIEPGTSKSQLARARAQLRQQLGART
jgi:RNA polymerase sigma-70 factor, ECF subfamily